jgi:hypothetical protein
VVPIAGEHPPEEPAASGWRGLAIEVLRRLLAALQRTSPPAAVVEGMRHHVADVLYELMGALAGHRTYRDWKTHTAYLTDRVIEVARRDPGRRVLVAVNLRHCHHIRPALRKHPEIRVVPYSLL